MNWSHVAWTCERVEFHTVHGGVQGTQCGFGPIGAKLAAVAFVVMFLLIIFLVRWFIGEMFAMVHGD